MLTNSHSAVPFRLRITGAACGIGAQDAACADGAVAFHRSQAWHDLEHHPHIDWGQTVFVSDEGAIIARIADFCRRLADNVERTLRVPAFPVVIGGDHSVAIGTWSGVARALGQPVGLLWIDAHLDSHTPETSYSGAVHGMPLACLLGRGDKRLLQIGLPGQQVDARHTVLLGPRSYEPEEMDFLRQQGVRIVEHDEIEQRGFADCLAEAVGIIAGAPGGFGVTLDLDAIDPLQAPGVGSPEPDGLVAADVLAAIRRVAVMPGLLALEIVEYNPDRDREGRTAHLIASLIRAVLPHLEVR